MRPQAQWADPSEPLGNPRHEAFCQHYAGDCWGRANEACRKAGFRAQTDGAACTEGSRLLKRAEVAARVKHLREERAAALGVDQTYLLEVRLRLAKAAETAEDADFRAAASILNDIERSLGLNKPERLQVGCSLPELLAELDARQASSGQ